MRQPERTAAGSDWAGIAEGLARSVARTAAAAGQTAAEARPALVGQTEALALAEMPAAAAFPAGPEMPAEGPGPERAQRSLASYAARCRQCRRSY